MKCMGDTSRRLLQRGRRWRWRGFRRMFWWRLMPLRWFELLAGKKPETTGYTEGHGGSRPRLLLWLVEIESWKGNHEDDCSDDYAYRFNGVCGWTNKGRRRPDQGYWVPNQDAERA